MLGNSLLDYARIWVRGVVIAAVAVTVLALVVGSIVSGYIAGRVSFAAVYDAAVAPPELKAEWARSAKFREEYPYIWDFSPVPPTGSVVPSRGPTVGLFDQLLAEGGGVGEPGSWRQRTHERLADAGGLAGALSVTGGWTAVAIAWWRRRREQ